MKFALLSLLLILEIIPRKCKSQTDNKCANGGKLICYWWNSEPYIFKHSDSADFEGIFPDVLGEMISTCCHPDTVIEFKLQLQEPADCTKEQESGIDVDLVIPVGGNIDSSRIKTCPFIGIIESPGVAVLATANVSGASLILAVLDAWPILLFIITSAMLAGVVIWLLERKQNPEQFPPDFCRGIFEGFWWAFVTMTTVGYGDRAPVTVPGKFIGLIWMMGGLIITTIFIGIITSALSLTIDQGTGEIRGISVSAVKDSQEHRVGIQKMAYITALPTLDKVLEAIINRQVDVGLVDIHSLKHHNENLRKHNIAISNLLTNPVIYGITLPASSNSSNLESCLREYVEMNEDKLYSLLRKHTGAPKKRTMSAAEDYFGSGGIFAVTVYGGIGLFIILCCAGGVWEYYKSRSRKATGNEEEGSVRPTINENSTSTSSQDRSKKASMEKLMNQQSEEIMKMEQQWKAFHKDMQKKKGLI